MELLYTYIKGIGSCFENDEFTFSNEYFITYDKNTKKITINKNKNYKYKDFFSSKIRSINLVVGKNGAGKTTLLELLGSQKSERRQKFKFDRRCKKIWEGYSVRISYDGVLFTGGIYE